MIADDEIVCLCLKITAKDIRDSIARGNRTVERVADDTDAGTACTKCKSYDDDKRMMRKYHIKEDFLEE